MADIKSKQKGLFLRKQELRHGIELLFFAYRDFTQEADSLLAEINLDRAHHRVLHFVGRQAGINVSDLLSILNITKQSLSRVLSHLIDEDYVEQKTAAHDRRQRLLYLTDKGQKLEAQIAELQFQRFARAYQASGAEAVAGFRQILSGLLDDEARAHLERLEALDEKR